MSYPSIGACLTLIGAAVGFYWSPKGTFASFFRRPEHFWVSLMTAVLGSMFGYGVMWVAAGLDVLGSGFGTQAISQPSTFLLLELLFGGLAVPFVEELLVRGWFLELSTIRRIGRWVPALSACLFGLGHSEMWHAVLFGIVWVYIRIQTRSLWPSILLHSFNNLFVISLVLILQTLDAASLPSQSNESDLALALQFGGFGTLLVIIGYSSFRHILTVVFSPLGTPQAHPSYLPLKPPLLKPTAIC